MHQMDGSLFLRPLLPPRPSKHTTAFSFRNTHPTSAGAGAGAAASDPAASISALLAPAPAPAPATAFHP